MSNIKYEDLYPLLTKFTYTYILVVSIRITKQPGMSENNCHSELDSESIFRS